MQTIQMLRNKSIDKVGIEEFKKVVSQVELEFGVISPIDFYTKVYNIINSK